MGDMESIREIAVASVSVFLEAAPYVLLGFLVAGILRAFVGPDTVVRYLKRGRFRSVLYASLLGIPIPL
ncbi:MAG: hypothetical protein FJ118_18145 [Deltaproteobacteria bacterium]|nr:hypothetical protein [Deltaproteobacteria bacterium]